SRVRAVAFSSNGNTLASVGVGSIILWNPATAKELSRFGRPFINVPCCVAFSPDGKTMVTGDQHLGVLTFFDLVKGTKHHSLRNAHDHTVRAVAFSPDGKTLASAGEEGNVQLWDVALRKNRLAAQSHRGEVSSLAITPDGKMVVTANFIEGP